jgi:hypothetical protein
VCVKSCYHSCTACCTRTTCTETKCSPPCHCSGPIFQRSKAPRGYNCYQRLLIVTSLTSILTYLLYADESSENDDDDDYPDADEEGEDETGSGTDLDAYPSDDDEEPAPAPPIRSVKAAHTSLKPSTPANRGAGICLVPNCGKPSFVDRGGVKAEYCSTRHRE